MRLIDADACPKLFDAEFKKTKRLILDGEKHLDNLAEGFMEAYNVIRQMPTIAPPPNDPLTLEQLREIGLEPVPVLDLCTVGTGSVYVDAAKNYGKTWIVFRIKQEEGITCKF